MISRCLCCNRVLKIVYGRTKLCNNCALYTTVVRREIAALKNKVELWKRRCSEAKKELVKQEKRDKK